MTESTDDVAIHGSSRWNDRWNEGESRLGLVARNGESEPLKSLQFLPINIGGIRAGLPPLVDLYHKTPGPYSLYCKAQTVFTRQARQRLVRRGVTELYTCLATDSREQLPLIASMIGMPDEKVPPIAKAGLLYQSTAELARLPFAGSVEPRSLSEARLTAAIIAARLATNPTVLKAIVRLMRHSPASYVHSVNTCIYAMLLGRELRLDDGELRDLGLAALLHDVGKLRVPLDTLDKPSALNSEEWATVRSHPTWSESLLAEAGLSERILAGIRQHHERLDGSGYPLGLQGSEIGKVARIVALADSYDAMTSARSYHLPVAPLDALMTMYLEVGVHYDPDLFPAFVHSLEPCWAGRSRPL
jgi:hypothetical protein